MNQLTIIMYHYVRPIKDSPYPKIKGIELEGFRRQLDFLAIEHTFITAEQLVGFSHGQNDLPKNACYLTFDDGYKDHIQYVMPELLKRNIQGSFFPPVNAVTKREMLDVNAIHFILESTHDYQALAIDLDHMCKEYGHTEFELDQMKNKWAKSSRYDSSEVMYIKHMLQHALPKNIRSEIVDRLFQKNSRKSKIDFSEELYMSTEEVKKLVQNDMYVGSHGCGHVWLGKESKQSQLAEINSSLVFLEKVGASHKNWIMCYPFGDYNDDTLEILKSRQCSIGLTTQPGFANINNGKFLELSRFDTNDFPQ